MRSARLWLRAGDLPDGPVMRWHDAAGRGASGAAKNETAAPVAGAVTGTGGTSGGDGSGSLGVGRAVSFDAARKQQLAFGDVMRGATEGDLIVVLRAAAARPKSARGLLRWGGKSTSSFPDKKGLLAESFGSASVHKFAPPSPETPEADITRWHVYRASSSPARWLASLDGEVLFRTDKNKVKFPRDAILGQGSGYFDGAIAEMLVFDRALDDASLAVVRSYLESSYNPPANIHTPPTPAPAQPPSPTAPPPRPPPPPPDPPRPPAGSKPPRTRCRGRPGSAHGFPARPGSSRPTPFAVRCGY
ncbi:MAG: hypothetical protein LBK99_16190 [Opitutaceae bacterium]|jgi:hypothetical protein|nr:hypothetical protein [Opitutaceae bacterium]